MKHLGDTAERWRQERTVHSNRRKLSIVKKEILPWKSNLVHSVKAQRLHAG